MSAWQVYLLMKMDSIKAFLLFSYFTLVLITIAYMILFCANSDIESEAIQHRVKSTLTKLGAAFGIVLLLELALPSTKTSVLMYIVPKVTQNKQIQEIPPLLLKYIKHQLQK